MEGWEKKQAELEARFERRERDLVAELGGKDKNVAETTSQAQTLKRENEYLKEKLKTLEETARERIEAGSLPSHPW